VSYAFTPLPLTGQPADEKLRRLRFNSLGSLFYFTRVCLGRRRLTESFHLPFCLSLEREFLKDVYEIPRDHFKSTICSEALPMWLTLPFMQSDEDAFLTQGYGDEYIRFLKRMHNPMRRNLLVSENVTNAAKLGKRIEYHFQSNAIFRGCFSEILPTSSETWTSYSMHVNRGKFGGASHGEGSFDFLGVGGALQSRHYDNLFEDDLIGRKAIQSPSVMDQSIEYHKLLIGAFDSQDAEHENNELVVANRWGFHDLNSHIRENEPWFVIHSHSALGGCCDAHPSDTPIFPEEFSFEKLMRFKQRLGSYHFSCQFLNNPISPEDADFKSEWLKYYSFERGDDGGVRIQQESHDGLHYKPFPYHHLQVAMAVDPAHSGNSGAGRARHAIVVWGQLDDDYFLLDAWAQQCTLGTFVDKIYALAQKWRLRKFGVETVAGQIYLKFHLDTKNAQENNYLKIIPLKGEVEGPDGTMTRKKEWRIRNVLSPLFEFGHVYVQRRHQDFIGEYNTFPRGKFVDLLDASAYIPQMLRHAGSRTQSTIMLANNQQRARLVNTPYSDSSILRVN
jgi:phage terminase large subunit-like protein